MLKLVTIGGYGYSEERFFDALKVANVDTFVDIRQRRGMRGPKYAFLNSERLQASLARAGIRYVHAKALAPTTEVRSMQKTADRAEDVSKQRRTQLTPEFVETYQQAVLSNFGASKFAALVGPSATIVAFFCVEGQPLACHRSIVVRKYASDLNLLSEDLIASPTGDVPAQTV